MSHVTWYFDFISPFAYLQLRQLEAWSSVVELECRPVLFAGLLNHWGHKGPAEIASKRRFTYRHVQWLASRQGVPFRMPEAHPFNPLGALRLAVALDNFTATKTIFEHIWVDGRRPDTEAGWADLTARLEIDDVSSLIARPAVKQTLRSNGERAVGSGVFGVPTLVVDDELFWGLDATEMAADYIRSRATFEEPEMQRVSDLPIGVARDV